MTRDHITSLLFPLTLAACSDSAAPTPGSFNAQLSGARNAALSGDAYTERNFVEVRSRFVVAAISRPNQALIR